MPRSIALLLVPCLAAAGCFRAHGIVGEDAGVDLVRPDAARPDAFVPADAARHDTGFDVGPPDAFAPDAAGCMDFEVGTPRNACVLAATGTLPAGEPYALPLSFSRCECPESRRCEVTVVGNVVSLTTAVCNDIVACDECEFDVPCALPPLAAGHYFVDVNGARTMEVDAAPREVPTVARPVCAPIPLAPDAPLVCDLEARPAPSPPFSVCRPALEDVGRYVRIEVVIPCESCFHVDGGCETQLDGASVVLRPHLHRCDCPDCGVCDPACAPLTIACVTPPLSAGVYDVVVESAEGLHDAGPLEIRDVFDPGDRVCVDVR